VSGWEVDDCDFCLTTHEYHGRGFTQDQHTVTSITVRGIVDNGFVGDSEIWVGGRDLDNVFKDLDGCEVEVTVTLQQPASPSTTT
jgi:hypothetical protein